MSYNIYVIKIRLQKGGKMIKLILEMIKISKTKKGIEISIKITIPKSKNMSESK